MALIGENLGTPYEGGITPKEQESEPRFHTVLAQLGRISELVEKLELESQQASVDLRGGVVEVEKDKAIKPSGSGIVGHILDKLDTIESRVLRATGHIQEIRSEL